MGFPARRLVPLAALLACAGCGGEAAGGDAPTTAAKRGFGGTPQIAAWSSAARLTDPVTIGGADKSADITPPNSKAFRYLGGAGRPAFEARTAAQRRYVGYVYRIDGAAGFLGLPNWSVATTTDARKVTFRIVGSRGQAVRLRVDGRPGAVKRLTRPGTPQYDVTVTFPSEATRTVVLEAAGYRMLFLGGTTSSAYTPLKRPKEQWGARTIVLGDSWTEGSGVVERFDDFPQAMGRELGLADVWSSGLGGTGYVKRFAINKKVSPNFVQRLRSDVIARKPSTVIVAGGGNDRKASPRAFSKAVRTVFQRLHRDLPHARLIALGPWSPNGAVPRVAERQAATIRKEVEAVGGQFISTRRWITGYGSTVNRRRDGGNADRYIGPTYHPTRAGQIYLGKRLADAMRRLPAPPKR